MTGTKSFGSAKLAMLVVLISLWCVIPAYATEPKSLDEVTATAAATEAVKETQSTVKEKKASSKDDGFIDSLSGAAYLGEEQEQAKEIGNALNKVGSLIFQVAGYVVSIGLGLLIAVDMIYVAIPWSRALLANGYVGNAQAGNTQAQNGGDAGFGGGGFGGGGFGGGGFGGRGFGGGGFGGNGGFGGGMGGMGGMGGQQGGMANQNQPANGRMQLVSNAALNAVATETAGQTPFKVYIKQTAILCIMAPLILVLASTGVLSGLGFAAGQALSEALSAIRF